MKKFYLFILLMTLFGVGFGQYSGSGTFTIVSSLEGITNGYYVIAESNDEYAMNNIHNGTYLSRTAISPSSGELTDPSTTIVWKIETNGSGKSIYNEVISKYVSYTGSSNNVQIVDAVTSDNQRWTITYSNNVFTFTNIALTTRMLQYNASSPRFACYTSNQRKFLLYKMIESGNDPTISISPSSLTDFTYEVGNGPSSNQTFTVQGANLTADITITPPADYEISTDGSSYQEMAITLTQSGGTVNETTIYTRLEAGLSIGDYNEDITLSSTGATDKTVSCNGSVTGNQPSAGDLIITEVCGTGTDEGDGFMEIFNTTSATIDLGNVQARYWNSNPNNSSPTTTIDLSGEISAYGYIIVARNSSDFTSHYGYAPDFANTSFYFNGGDDGCDIYNSNTTTILDLYNDNGTTAQGHSAWNWSDSYTWNRNTRLSGESSSSWTQSTTGTPKEIGLETWDGSTSTSWTENANWLFATPTSSTNITIPSGALNYPSVSGDATTPSECNDLTVQVSASLTIPATKALTVNGDLNNDGTFTINSTSSGTGSLKVVGSVSGSVNVDRCIGAATWGSANDGWHFLSSPVASQSISGDWTPDGSSSNDYDFYAWDEVTHYWLNQKDGSNSITSFTVGEGYMVAYQAESTNTFTGTLNNSDVSGIALTRTESAYDDNSDAGFNLLGNPYPCALDWNDGNWTLTNVAATAKIWSNSSQSYMDIAANDEIPSMNGFMVQLTSGTSGSITIPSASRVHDAKRWYKSSDNYKIKLAAIVVDGQAAQYSTIQLNEEAAVDFDIYYDSRFLAGYAPLFYSLKGENRLSTYSTPELSDNAIIPFGFMKNSANEFAIELVETIDGKTIFLTDKKMNITHNLSDDGSYYFASTEADDPNRFEIHFSAVGVEENIETNSIYAYSFGNTITVLNNERYSGEVSVLNITGQVIVATTLSGDHKQDIRIDAQSGVYIVVINTVNGSIVSEKLIITQ